MPVMTLFVLCALGVLAWLLAGGWPYARDLYLADEGPVGLGAGITALCPACTADSRDSDGLVEAQLASPRGRIAAARAQSPVGTSGLRPLAVGRDQSLRLECPSCGTTFAVLGAGRLVPTPRQPAD